MLEHGAPAKVSALKKSRTLSKNPCSTLAFEARHFLTGEELSRAEILALLEAASFMKMTRGAGEPKVLAGKTLALIFEKPSLRTRVSFTVGIQELGGSAIELQGSQLKNEEPEDSIRVLQGMVHGVMIRTFAHAKLERMLPFSKIPVINGLSDTHHPCQILADLLTLQERHGRLQGLTLTYIGDGNNILHSLLLMLPLVGVNVNYCCPKGYQPDPSIVERAHARSVLSGATLRSFSDPAKAAKGAHALYTDVWTSMGFEAENEARLKAFAGYQINADLLKKADPSAILLHCLPMIRGLEITSDVVESPASALFQQAENRLHAQKALLLGLYQGRLRALIE